MSNFDETVHKAIELAKSITAPDEVLHTTTLLASLIEVSNIKTRFPALSEHFQVPETRYDIESGRKTSNSVKEVLEQCFEEVNPIDVDTLFQHLIFQEDITKNISPNKQVYVEQTRVILEREKFKNGRPCIVKLSVSQFD